MEALFGQTLKISKEEVNGKIIVSKNLSNNFNFSSNLSIEPDQKNIPGMILG